ncbi:ferritin [Prevotella dentasini]|uniref:ferritin n=1 Tax=Prevotella dentasini TaxID=589537 RepID=UPI000469B388|nr:ferritin [Prevotella dentasini]
MDISKKMQDAFNAQITAELWSSNLYLQMSFWFRNKGWRGFAGWMAKQAEEERGHALDMANYVCQRNGRASFGTIDAVPTEWNSPEEIFRETLKHEQHVTELINKLADVADDEKDRASQNFIAKYIDEQVEEEYTVSEIIDLFNQMPEHAISHVDSKVAALK